MKLFLRIAIILCAAGIFTAKSQTVYYVQITGNDFNDGISWVTAFATVTKALSVAASGDQIWVSQGTYYPTSSTDRTKSFVLVNGAALYGGFAGTETLLSQRNVSANGTILSGDIDGDFTPSGNSYHVVSATSLGSLTRLDGFTISGGNADNASGNNNVGAGLYFLLSSVQLANLTISSNISASDGAGMWSAFGSPILNNSTVTGNQSAGSGGGLYIGASSMTLQNVQFTNNTAVHGGGLDNTSSGTVALVDVTFKNNQATGASSSGGGMENSGTTTSLTNVVFWSNASKLMGGGLNSTAGNTSLTNVTFAKDSSKYGGAIFVTGSCTMMVKNSILFSDTCITSGAEVYTSSSTTPVFAYTLVEGGINGSGVSSSSSLDGGNNIDADPLFTNSMTGDLSLMSTSPAIDVGDSSAVTETTDIANNARISGTTIDLGAYEYQAAVLPVELSSWSASANGRNVQLMWVTSTETNNYGFQVERRGVHAGTTTQASSAWQNIGFVPGNGTSASEHRYSYTDKNISPGTVAYRLKQVDNAGAFKYSQEMEVNMVSPRNFVLNQNYPNPFNPTTIISFQIPENVFVSLVIYDVTGRVISKLVSEEMPAGSYTRTWNAHQAASGIYFYRLQAGVYNETRKLLLVK